MKSRRALGLVALRSLYAQAGTGVHFSAYCSELLEPRVLGEVRKLIG